MRTSFKTAIALPATLALGLALAGCGTGADTTEDDMPEPEISESPDIISDEAIEEANPGIEEADPDGDTSNTADFEGQGENNAEYSDVGDPPERD